MASSKGSAGFFEGFEGVGVEHFGPEVAVVAGGVAAREDVLEVRGAVAHHHHRRACPSRRARPSRGRATSRSSAASSRWRSRSTSAEAVYSTVAKPWLKRRAARTLSSSASGIGSPVSAWTANLRSTSGCFEPVLVELARELDEIARHVGAGDQRIGDVGEEAVEGVAELVEQRARVVEAERASAGPRAPLRSSSR